jgi:hypothetical protein
MDAAGEGRFLLRIRDPVEDIGAATKLFDRQDGEGVEKRLVASMQPESRVSAWPGNAAHNRLARLPDLLPVSRLALPLSSRVRAKSA